VGHGRIEEHGKELDRRLLQIVQTEDPQDEQAIDMYAEQVAGKFCRAGIRDIAANLMAADPKNPEQDFSKFTEEMMPNLPYYREEVEGIKRQIYQAIQYLGGMNQKPLG